MLKTLVKNLFGSRNDRLLKEYGKKVQQINSLEEATKKLSDVALKAKTSEFKKRLTDGQKLDDLLAEAFAVVRETSRRVLEMRHFDVQLIGGMALHDGKISEMRTGEGKTLVATLPTYLNALTGRGVHVVTVNDYLARRDAGWMGQVYTFLGLSVGVIVHGLDDDQRGYLSDATCAGLQLVNFWQDIERDLAKGRIYVPAELSAIAGAREADLLAHRLTPGWAAALTDAALQALIDNIRPGLREYELGAIVETAALNAGGLPHLCYLSSGPQDGAGACVACNVASDCGTSNTCITRACNNHSCEASFAQVVGADGAPVFKK